MVFGVQRALSLQLLDFSTFDLVAYETYEKVEMGDWNWLTPGFVAFASPVEPGYVARIAAGGKDGGSYDGSKRLSRAFRNVLDEFAKEGVKAVVMSVQAREGAVGWNQRADWSLLGLQAEQEVVRQDPLYRARDRPRRDVL